MKISIANISQTIGSAEFSRVVRAVAKQVRLDFAPVWGVSATVKQLEVPRGKKPIPDTDTDIIIYVGELDDDPQSVQGAIGYHDLNHGAIPYGFVFTDVAAKVGEAWSVTLSHEVVELLADPDVNLLCVGPHPKRQGASVLRSYEVADPTQSDTYEIDGVEVSNWVTPAYFVAGSTQPTNHLELPLKPFGVRPGGYFSYFDLSTNKWNAVFGDKAAATRAKAKRGMGSLRRMGRHAGLGLAK